MELIIVRGGGDLASGIVHRLFSAGFKTLILETERPSAIRRQVSFCEAVYDGKTQIEGLTAELVNDAADIEKVFDRGNIPVMVDPEGRSINKLQADVLVDAMIAKKNLGTHKDMARLVIGVGPGFTAGDDVDVVIETMRGHNLARIITEGSALPNTGIPGNIGGFTKERVIHAPKKGVIKNIKAIGDTVEAGEEIAIIYDDMNEKGQFLGEGCSVKAEITGIIRGLIRDSYQFDKGFKIADIDPRESELANCFTISDKARSIGGSVLEVVCAFAFNNKKY